MKRYLKLFWAQVKINVKLIVEYRANFYNSVLSTISWGAISIVTMVLLTSRSSSVGAWSRDELLLLTGCYSIMIGIFHTFLSMNFGRISRFIDMGEFDFMLLKPMDAQFAISTRRINFSALLRILIGIGFTTYMLNKMHVAVSLTNLSGFFVLTIAGVMILYSIWFAVSALIFWHPRLNNLAEFLYNFNNVTRYPQEVVQEAGQFVFLFLFPMTLVVTTPTKLLLHRVLTGDIVLALFFAIVFFMITRLIWKFALRAYTSASS